MKNDVMFDGEQSLRTDEARLRKLAAFKIAASQRNGESIGVRAAGDLAENQIFSWKIGNHQSRPALSASAIGSRKRNDNNFAGYRFDHAASSSGEFQSRPRTDPLSSAPLNALFSSDSFEATSFWLDSRVLINNHLMFYHEGHEAHRLMFGADSVIPEISVVKIGKVHLFEFFGGSSPAKAGKLPNERIGPCSRVCYFFEFLDGNSRTNDQEISAVWPLSYSILKCERNFFGMLTRTGTASGEILFALLIVACGSKNESPSSNSTSKASSQSR